MTQILITTTTSRLYATNAKNVQFLEQGKLINNLDYVLNAYAVLSAMVRIYEFYKSNIGIHATRRHSVLQLDMSNH
jgi:hypothetical protein